jgi:hypothetical protein
LTIIFKMGYGACSSHYYTKRLPIQSFWLRATSRPPDYPWYTTSNCRRSVDTHFQEVVGHVPLVIFNILVAGTSKTVSYVPLSIFGL